MMLFLLTKPQEKAIFVGLITNDMKRILMPLLATLAILPSCGKKPLLLTENNIPKIVNAMTDEEKAHLLIGANHQNPSDSTQMLDIAAYKDMVPGCGGFTFPISRLGIPSIVFADGPAGLRIADHREGEDRTYYCTAFPIGSLLAATWDPALVENVCAAIGNEVREYGVDVLLAPGENLHRNPLCGRNFEYFSEDPVLAGKMAAAYVRGVQSQGVGTTAGISIKYNNSFIHYGYDRRKGLTVHTDLDTRVSVLKLHPGITEQAVRDILLGEWGYKGLVITDWGGGNSVVAQINAGNPFIAPGTEEQYQELVKGIADGSVNRKALDEGVTKVLEMIVKTPRFKGYAFSNNPDLEAHASLSRQAAGQGMVLLENRSATLPLAKDATVAVFGANSYKLIAGGTGAGDVNGWTACRRRASDFPRRHRKPTCPSWRPKKSAPPPSTNGAAGGSARSRITNFLKKTRLQPQSGRPSRLMPPLSPCSARRAKARTGWPNRAILN